MMKPHYTEYDVMCALEEVANGKSLRKACLEWGIPRSTLRDRNAITQIRREAADHLQRLPTVIEDRLTNWILNQEALGCYTRTDSGFWREAFSSPRGPLTSRKTLDDAIFGSESYS